MDLMRIHAMKETLTEWAKCEFDKGMACIDTDEMGKVIDMIKDLAQAEKDCYEAKELKGEMGDFDGADRMGYDSWRYSSGRFAPKGHGHRAGYVPTTPPYMMSDMGTRSDLGKPDTDHRRMGYDNPDRMMDRPWDRYQEAKRHYHETGSKQDKDEMSESAKEHLDETFDTMKDIWKEADPQMKQRMKADLQVLMNDLK